MDSTLKFIIKDHSIKYQHVQSKVNFNRKVIPKLLTKDQGLKQLDGDRNPPSKSEMEKESPVNVTVNGAYTFIAGIPI